MRARPSHAPALTSLLALLFASCAPMPNGVGPGRVPAFRWNRIPVAPCGATVLLPQPTRQETLEPGQTEDGSSVDTRKWRYEAEDTTFAVTCERLDRGTWGLAWAQHAALGIFTQFQASNSKTTGVQESPVQVGKLVGIAIESTSPDDRGRLLARFVTHDAVALQLIATFPDDPRWRSAAKTFVQSLRADDHLSKVSSNAKDEATLAAFASTLGAKQR